MMISWFNVRSLGMPEKSTVGGHAQGKVTTMTFYIRDWSMLAFCYLREVLKPIAHSYRITIS